MKTQKEMMSKVIGVVVLGAVVLSTGCTHVYVPKESEYKTDVIPVYTVASKVTLVNGQTDDTEIEYAHNMGHTFVADKKDWTEQAIGIAERELNERGAGSAARNDKKLTLRVSDVQVSTGVWGFRGTLTLDVATGDGVAKTFKGEAPAANLYNASSGCLSAAVAAMLSDQTIMYYLTN
ncbi:hypothetical protein P4B35_05155 [Pontiellaceae bacterium B12227]|nr:hypothetical protein [Pontiellaceae bacterium B12227]